MQPLTRPEADRVFRLVADLRGDLRERVVNDRWWLIWILTGLQIPITCTLTQMFFWNGVTRVLPFLLLWTAQVGVLFLTIKFVHRRQGGQRTERENFIWWIWSTFLSLTCFVGLGGAVVGLPLASLGPILPVLGTFSFCMMAMTVDLSFLVGAAFFLLVGLAMCAWPPVQFIVYGLAWALVLISLGLYFRPNDVAVSKAL